ncbi:MAG TPA: serine hydrolase [Flavipsychrobacter sp.]|nr:serine hydrolase [Flavipsychrobacter sp.]
MKKLLPLFIVTWLIQSNLNAQTGIYVPSMHKTESLSMNFMKNHNVPGGTVAITKDGKLIYNRAFGWANTAKNDSMRPYHLLRIASNSKAITGIAVMKLVENNQLSLDDTVFGANKILNHPYYLNAISDQRIYNITVRQLLEHTAGWDRGIGCDGYSHCDPIGFPLHVTNVLGEGNPVQDTTLIKFLLTKGLNHNPGTTYAYSNITYLMLAKVIEKKTGMSYESYVSSVIMQPVGLCDMHLGKNLLANKQEREGEYIATPTTLSAYGNNQMVPWQYGGWNLEAMHAHGGWISTSADYTRMILAVDNFSTVPDILNSSTITTMTTASPVTGGYAMGWSVNSFGNWWHTGSLDGTSAFMARTNNGYTWAFHFNTRAGGNFWNQLDALPWNCIAATTNFPTHDLFAPSLQAGNLSITKAGSTNVNLSWTNGNGDKRIVVASENNLPATYPLDGKTYNAGANFGSGDNIGSSAYIVYNGNGNGITVTGLDSTKTYAFTVYEYFENSNTGNNAVYKLGCNEKKTISMSATSVTNMEMEQFHIRPNPAQEWVKISMPENMTTEISIVDMAGREMFRGMATNNTSIDISQLAKGIYTVNFFRGDGRISRKLVKL